MAIENKDISTITTDIGISGVLTIDTNFDSNVSHLNVIKDVDIKSATGIQRRTNFTEGDLIMTVKNFPHPHNSYVNKDGEFVIIDEYSNKFSINSNCELEFNNTL